MKARSDSCCITASNMSRSLGAFCCGNSEASSVAATTVSRLRRPISALANLLLMISPCSVRRIWPFTVPGGCARMES
ncbi:hypothetical protein D3C72_1508090 [compost metagenome]